MVNTDTFYTNVSRRGNFIQVRGIKNGKRVKYKEKYSPFLFAPLEGGDYQDVHGQGLGRLDFTTMADAANFVKSQDGVHNSNIFGMTNYVYPFMNEEWPGTVKYNVPLLNIISFDIETMSDTWPDVKKADKEVTVVTMSDGEKYIVIGKGDFVTDREDVTYINCETEKELLLEFIIQWNRLDPDVITGWNIEFFDIPYIINRIKLILGDDAAKKLSPWKQIEERTFQKFGKDEQTYLLTGISILDYMAVYKKWRYKPRENHKLDHIAEVELGMGKIDYEEEYGSLHGLYTQNYQLYVKYNIRDTEIINQLEETLKLLELVYAIAYDAKINFNDAFSPVKTWDVIIHNKLMLENKAVPFMKFEDAGHGIVGGYVKEPIPGMYHWVASFDLDSLYPHLIMMYNISPEKYRGKMPDFFGSVDSALTDGYAEITGYLTENNLTMTPNSCLWDREGQGFLAALMESYYSDRKAFKRMMIDEETKFEETGEVHHKMMGTQYGMIQLAKKILLNSAYGALCNAYFRWNNSDFGEAITTSGQLATRWIENALNEFLNTKLKTDTDYVIAADTDSVYLNLENLVNAVVPDKTKSEIVDFIDKACAKIIKPYIDKRYTELAEYVNAREHKMSMKREAIADKAIWTGKKYYIMNVWDDEGVRLSEPKLMIKGIAAVKSSTPAVCREYIKESIRIIMKGDNDALINYINKKRVEFSSLNFEQVAFPRGVNGIFKYYDADIGWKKGTPIQVRGALVYNEICKERGIDKTIPPIKDGDKVRFSYLMMPNPAKQNVIAVSDMLPAGLMDLKDYIDYNRQFNKSFLEPVKGITDVIGWQTERFATLEGLFG